MSIAKACPHPLPADRIGLFFTVPFYHWYFSCHIIGSFGMTSVLMSIFIKEPSWRSYFTLASFKKNFESNKTFLENYTNIFENSFLFSTTTFEFLKALIKLWIGLESIEHNNTYGKFIPNFHKQETIYFKLLEYAMLSFKVTY